MRTLLFTSTLALFTLPLLLNAQVNSVYGAWIEVHQLSDSMEIQLKVISQQGTLLPMSQTIGVFEIASNGTVNALPALQAVRLSSVDSGNLRISVFGKKMPPKNVAMQFAWNSCCRGHLLNANNAAVNESMVTYTRVFPNVVAGSLPLSARITSIPSLNVTRYMAQTTVLSWQMPLTNTTSSVQISTPVASLSHGQPVPVNGIRLPSVNELTLNGQEFTLWAADAGNMAFNLSYTSTTAVNGVSILLSHIDAAFQVNIAQATSVRNLFNEHQNVPLEIYDMLGRQLFRSVDPYASLPSLNAGSYLFKRGNRIEKVFFY